MHGSGDVSLWQAATTQLQVFCNISAFPPSKVYTECLSFIYRWIWTDLNLPYLLDRRSTSGFDRDVQYNQSR